jgi:hypothetical protein
MSKKYETYVCSHCKSEQKEDTVYCVECGVMRDHEIEEVSGPEEYMSCLLLRCLVKEDEDFLTKALEETGVSVTSITEADPHENSVFAYWDLGVNGRRVLHNVGIHDKSDYKEYFIEVLAFDEKETVIKDILNSFAVCLVREEFSNYIIANDEDVAEYLWSDSDGDLNEVFSKMLSGQERMLLIKNYLYYAGPRELTTDADAQESFMQWKDGKLIPFATISDLEILPTEWSDYLVTLDEFVFSTSERPVGVTVAMESIYKEVKNCDGNGESPVICVLKGGR